jgi:L-serine dehydratase
MFFSVFDIFKIGLGPSSSHTVGPMRAACRFAKQLQSGGVLQATARVEVELFGSLALTGRGHATDTAIILGLAGHTPDGIDPEVVPAIITLVTAEAALDLLGSHRIIFQRDRDMVFHYAETLPGHPNGMRFNAFDAAGVLLDHEVFYSVGGGFVMSERELFANEQGEAVVPDVPFPFANAAELLDLAERNNLTIAEIVRANERAWRDDAAIDAAMGKIWNVMQDCVARGCRTEGTLPGGLNVPRRAAAMYRSLVERPENAMRDPLTVMDWVNLYAIAVNEENAAGGRVVTAPTNGAAGIVPAVLHYYERFCIGANPKGIHDFLLTATAIGILYKQNASISGAEVGCQGEVGVACSMAAAGLAAALGATNRQIENAAEIAMEHNLGLTCDPVAGLVQIPCIERNAMGAIKAINATRLALRGDGSHLVSLDRVIETMRQTGADMDKRYKETSTGGLAVNVVEC